MAENKTCAKCGEHGVTKQLDWPENERKYLCATCWRELANMVSGLLFGWLLKEEGER